MLSKNSCHRFSKCWDKLKGRLSCSIFKLLICHNLWNYINEFGHTIAPDVSMGISEFNHCFKWCLTLAFISLHDCNYLVEKPIHHRFVFQSLFSFIHWGQEICYCFQWSCLNSYVILLKGFCEDSNNCLRLLDNYLLWKMEFGQNLKVVHGKLFSLDISFCIFCLPFWGLEQGNQILE